jgi:hypothetical protein
VRTLYKRLIAIAAAMIAGLACLAILLWAATAGPRKEYRERELALKALLQAHCHRDDVIRTLGLKFVDFSVGSTNRWVIDERVSNSEVRERAARFPGLLFHTTAHWMTWIYFDSDGRLQDYYLCPQ